MVPLPPSATIPLSPLKLSVLPLEPHFESWTEHYAWREVEVNSSVYNTYAINSPFDIGCFPQKKKSNIQCPKFLQTEDKHFFPFPFFWGGGSVGSGLCCITYWNLSSLIRDQTWAPGRKRPNHQTLGNSLVRISFRNF